MKKSLRHLTHPRIFNSRGPAGFRVGPTTALLLSFAVCITAGTVFLLLPFCTAKGGDGLSFTNALFVSTSAVCVTGLSPLDVGTRLSFSGQAVLLALIQVGGLGFLTVATGLLAGLRRRSPWAMRHAVAETMSGGSEGPRFAAILRSVFVMTFVAEGLGALLLTIRFAGEPGVSLAQATWWGVFHAVSAFCNAGFSLFSNGLIRSADDFFVQAVVIVLIVLGGLGFFVVEDLRRWLTGFGRGSLSLHSKIVLSSTVALLVGGAVLFVALEYGRSGEVGDGLGAFSAGVFQSVTARTAGFSTVNISGLSAPTLMLLMGLMFIGGSPASCAGGIKTTTAFVWFRLAVARWRKRRNPTAFGRELGPETVARAVTLTLLSFFFVMIVCALVLTFEVDRIKHPLCSGGFFLDVLFESVSAFGTVGLSTGVTPLLSAASKVVLVAAMFVGRLGPLTVFLRLAQSPRKDKVRLPEETVLVG